MRLNYNSAAYISFALSQLYHSDFVCRQPPTNTPVCVCVHLFEYSVLRIATCDAIYKRSLLDIFVFILPFQIC